MELLQETLENGARVVVKPNHFSPTVAIQVWVRVGSLHEGAKERGMAHFIEHMLFKGTARRGVGEIAAEVESAGGEINAYTTFDHTVFHLTLAGEKSALGIDLLFDAFANSAFDPQEFEREKEVIREEIKRSADSPGAKIGRRIFEICFAGSEAARPILGSDDSVKGFSRDELFAFYRRWYQPQNIHIVVVGAVEPDLTMTQIKESFGSLKRGSQVAGSPEKVAFRRENAVGKGAVEPVVSIIRGDFKQPRLEMVFPAPTHEELDSTALDVAAFALGTGEMARLNRRLRDGDGVVTSVSASVYAPSFGGIFEISAVMEEASIPDAVAGLAREISRLREQEPVTSEEIRRARVNLKADRIFRDETVDGQARSLGFGQMTSQGVLYDEVYSTLVNAMPDATIAEAIRTWVRPEWVTIVLLVQESAMITEEAVAKAFREGLKAAASQGDKKGTSTQGRSVRARREAEVLDLMPGVRLVYRQNPDVKLFTLTAATEGGLRAETKETAGIFNAISGMLGTATGKIPYEDLKAEVEGMGASLEGFSGKDSMGFHLQCLNEDTERALHLFRECMMDPAFPEEQWTSLRREIDQALRSQSDSPASICIRRFQEMLFGEHPYRYPLFGTEDSVKSFSAAQLLREYSAWRDRGPWTLAVVAPGPLAPVAEQIRQALAGFAPQTMRPKFASGKLGLPEQGGVLRVPKDREQTHIVYGFQGIKWDDKDRPALDVLVNVLGGHGGRLFKQLRDRDSLAYTVSPIISYGRDPGVVGAYIACAPSKTARALESLKTEMFRLTEEAPSTQEVERAKSFIVGTHEMSLQKSDSQSSTMALMELYGYGFDDFLTYPKRIQAVTKDQVKAVASRLFQRDRAAEVAVGPTT